MHAAMDWLDQCCLAKREAFGQNICFSDGHSNVLGACPIYCDSDSGIVNAEVLTTGATELAVAAVQSGVDRDPGADSHFHIPRAVSLQDVSSHCNDLACKLVARHNRIAYQGRVAIYDMQVGAANTTGPHSYHQLVRFRRRVWKAPYPHFARSVDDSCTHNCPLVLVGSIQYRP